MRNMHSFIFCLIGGILIWLDAFTGSLGFLEKLTLIGTFTELQPFYPIIEILLYVLGIIAALGGISVVIGGALLTTDRVGTGKFIIGLGAGMSLIGLVIKLVQEIWIASSAAPLFNFVSMVIQSIGWIGVILSIIGRRTAAKPE